MIKEKIFIADCFELKLNWIKIVLYFTLYFKILFFTFFHFCIKFLYVIFICDIIFKKIKELNVKEKEKKPN